MENETKELETYLGGMTVLQLLEKTEKDVRQRRQRRDSGQRRKLVARGGS